MSKTSGQALTFRPRARIIRTIGDQLISGPEAAVIELVKNAYDADASHVSIRFEPPLKAGFGRIVVSDDGHGMSATDVVEKWMEPATSSKVSGRRSAGGRTMLGSKGIGRFAAAKLGRRMRMISVSQDGKARRRSEIRELDWGWFEDDRYLADVAIPFDESATDEPTGTTIDITDLREAWSQGRMEDLITELRRLVSPVQARSGEDAFRIFLDLSECSDRTCGFEGAALLGVRSDELNGPDGLGAEVRPFPLLASSDYFVSGHFDDQGHFHGAMEIRRGGLAPKTIDLSVPLKEGERACGRVDVHFSIFDREADVIRDTMRRAGMGELSAAKAREFLDGTAGVSIYRDGFRVRPYGSLENDWLALDSRRVQDPSFRIGHNQIAGYLTVESQGGSHLIERSSREGFEENGAFRRLRRLVIELLAKVVEPRRLQFRQGAKISRAKKTAFEQLDDLSELKGVRQLIAGLPAAKRDSAEQTLNRETAKIQQQIEDLRERQRVLEAKSSLGLIVGEILHEGGPDANFVAVAASRLRNGWKYVFSKGPQSEKIIADFPERLELLASSGERLRMLFTSLKPLAGGRRTEPYSFNAINVIRDTFGIFDAHGTRFEVENLGDIPNLFGHPEDLATALLNLFSNAVFWLEQGGVEHPRVHIVVRTPSPELASIVVEDNGRGVPDEFADQIFDIRFTLKEGGTGLGLNIAQEALVRSGGRLLFHPASGSGAKFEIQFPRYRGNDG